jgi:hypothetical protein
MTDKQLSLATQAVLDEVLYKMCAGESESYAQMIAAAALKAAADQVVPDEEHPGESQFWDDEADQEWQNNQHFRKKLLAIANELEGK